MKIYYYAELKEKSIDELLDLLFVYLTLQKDIFKIIKIDPDNKDFYLENNVYFYQLNIIKIKNELEIR